MKKIAVIIIFVIIVSVGVSVYAEYIEPLPNQPPEYPYMLIGYYVGPSGNQYILYYSNIPLRVGNYREWGSGKYVWDLILPAGIEYRWYSQTEGNSEWVYYGTFSRDEDQLVVIDDVVYTNHPVGSGLVDLEIAENNRSFFGIDFNYSGFWGDLKVQLGKKEESGTYKVLKEWQYPRGTGHVSIPASEIPQENKGEYRITIYEGDIIIKQYPYVLNVEKEPYCEISYPVNGQSYNYYPNVNISYYDMGILSIYINGEMYKRIFTEGKEGIDVIEGKKGIFDIGQNTVSVRDYYGGQVVATVQFEVLREGQDPNKEQQEFEAEGWVQELFNKIMNEYSLFFEYVRGIYGFLPVEILGLVVIIMMLAVVLWFTGRK